MASRNGFTRVPSTQPVTGILAGAAVAIWAVAIAFAGAVGAGLAKVWLLKGVRRVGGTRSSVLMLAEPVTGVLLAAPGRRVAIDDATAGSAPRAARDAARSSSPR